jgi:hypothetical protein
MIYASGWAANWIRAKRINTAWVNKTMTWLEDKMGERLSGTMRRTRPATAAPEDEGGD